MRKAVPVIYEPVMDVKQRLRRERDERKHLRLPMLYLLATQQADTCQELAHMLGLRRNTIGRWLADYESGGVA